MNIQSPQFSHSHKIDIAAHLSPSFRNKRVPSVQEIYTSSHWNRINSQKKLDSPSKLSEKKRKRSHNSQHKNKPKNNQSMQNIASEMIFLKDQYKSLKEAYSSLIEQKLKNTEEIQIVKGENQELKQQNERTKKDNEKLRNKIVFLELEIERIKKESFKLIQIEQFRVRKLEENLMDKEKAITNLMNSVSSQPSSIPISSPQNIPYQGNSKGLEDSYTFQAKQPNQSQNGFQINESLTLSHDKTLSNHSNSHFISISLTSMMQNESVYRNDVSTKRTQAQFLNSQAQHIQDNKAMSNITNKVNNKSSQNNFKKLRKEINKKIEVNIDRECVQEKNNPRTPLDRKISKSTKGSKTRLKKGEEEVCDGVHRSSKKKISHK